MKKWVGIAVLAGMMAGTGWAQETCHWYGLTQGFYRVIGTEDSEFISILAADGAFVWRNDLTNGTGTVEVNTDLRTTNWIRQEHMAFSNMALYQMVEVTEPSCAPQTGQSISYAVGDDGDLQTGHSWPDPRFTIQADTNLVVDNLTGLMWTRDATLGWNTWHIAVQTCYLPSRFGYDDWRLPSIREMESLMDLGESNPTLPLGHPFVNVGTNYWTGTADVIDPSQAWAVSLSGGTIVKLSLTNSTLAYWPVRTHTSLAPAPVPKTGQTNSVRSGDDGHLQPGRPWPIPRFTVMADTNLVFDNLVGRMWTRQAGIGGSLSAWSNAVATCNAFELGDYTDWRLPTRKEAWSLIDFGSPSYLPAGYPFSGGGGFAYWTSTTYDANPTNAWAVFGGLVGSFEKFSPGGAIWPIRGDW